MRENVGPKDVPTGTSALSSFLTLFSANLRLNKLVGSRSIEGKNDIEIFSDRLDNWGRRSEKDFVRWSPWSEFRCVYTKLGQITAYH